MSTAHERTIELLTQRRASNGYVDADDLREIVAELGGDADDIMDLAAALGHDRRVATQRPIGLTESTRWRLLA